MINAIFAIDEMGGMGVGNRLPWPFNKQDMDWFRLHTIGTCVVMGRKTWESADMITPLPNRINCVITTDVIGFMEKNPVHFNDPDGYFVQSDINHAIDYLSTHYPDKPLFCIGGASLLQSTTGLYNRLYVTHMYGDFNCDVVLDFDKVAAGYQKIYSKTYDMMEHAIYERVSRST